MSRIMINGIWYVPEISSQLELIEYGGCEYEDEEYSFDATILNNDEDSLSIEIIEKRTGKKSYFDNVQWLKSVLYSHPECIESARDYFTVSGLNTFIQFLRQLEHKGWL